MTEPHVGDIIKPSQIKIGDRLELTGANVVYGGEGWTVVNMSASSSLQSFSVRFANGFTLLFREETERMAPDEIEIRLLKRARLYEIGDIVEGKDVLNLPLGTVITRPGFNNRLEFYWVVVGDSFAETYFGNKKLINLVHPHRTHNSPLKYNYRIASLVPGFQE